MGPSEKNRPAKQRRSHVELEYTNTYYCKYKLFIFFRFSLLVY